MPCTLKRAKTSHIASSGMGGLKNNFDEIDFIKVIVSCCYLGNYKGFTNRFWQLYRKLHHYPKFGELLGNYKRKVAHSYL